MVILINPRQTSDSEIVYLIDGSQVFFNKNGTHFSDDASMKKIIEDLKSRGYKEIKAADAKKIVEKFAEDSAIQAAKETSKK